MAFGVVLAILLLGEAFHPYHAAGLALLVAGSYLASLKDKRAPA
jgi:drug/metabolite transporter (DMT)-like permease